MLETAILRKACSPDWSLAGIWEVGSQSVCSQQLINEWFKLLRPFVQTFMLNVCLAFGSLKFGYILGRMCLHTQPPVKTLGSQFLVGSPETKYCTHVVEFSLLKSVLC